jgi:putative hydrolase
MVAALFAVNRKQCPAFRLTSLLPNRYFAAAALQGVAIELDGDPARQDLDHTVARRVLESGCVFAVDSDAHTTTQLSYAETALAHASLAGILTTDIVNCWPLDQLLAWLSDAASARER